MSDVTAIVFGGDFITVIAHLDDVGLLLVGFAALFAFSHPFGFVCSSELFDAVAALFLLERAGWCSVEMLTAAVAKRHAFDPANDFS